MKKETKKFIRALIEKYPELEYLEESIAYSIKEIVSRVKKGGKILVCGNGGSASDSEHIVGELLKEFYIKRPIDEKFKENLTSIFPEDGEMMASMLQGGIPAISLVSQIGFLTAYANDASHDMAFAQQVYVYGRENDVFIGLSTSGNSKNVLYAAKLAKAKDIFTLCFTGEDGGKLKNHCDAILNPPATETYEVQEFHLPLYHLICRAVEYEIFGGNE